MTDGEKLALTINALRKIAGDPANDELVGELVGEPAWPSVRIARETLAQLGVSMTAPIRMRQQ